MHPVSFPRPAATGKGEVSGERLETTGEQQAVQLAVPLFVLVSPVLRIRNSPPQSSAGETGEVLPALHFVVRDVLFSTAAYAVRHENSGLRRKFTSRPEFTRIVARHVVTGLYLAVRSLVVNCLL